MRYVYSWYWGNNTYIWFCINLYSLLHLHNCIVPCQKSWKLQNWHSKACVCVLVCLCECEGGVSQLLLFIGHLFQQSLMLLPHEHKHTHWNFYWSEVSVTFVPLYFWLWWLSSLSMNKSSHIQKTTLFGHSKTAARPGLLYHLWWVKDCGSERGE